MNFKVKDVKNIDAHNSSIIVIEINYGQKIILTGGEDKYIYIRKIFDFEFLIAIDITYSFGNLIISTTLNKIPFYINISKFFNII